MTIITRFIRLCKADIHGVMDHLEDKELLLKQYLRDMEDDLNAEKTRLGQLTAANEGSRRFFGKYENEIARIEDEIETAIQKEKDDIARFLIRKSRPYMQMRNQTSRQMEAAEDEISQLKTRIEQRQAQLKDIQRRAREYSETIKAGTDLFDIGDVENDDAFTEEEIELELFRRKEKLPKEAVA